ncbi:hypothetical protein BD626DRAFT_572723 [Schizophyllum amplum]|uniref:Uncharacterized protein n=1 Tax=Schizophyllum amplum TaxID=97359 RepID=A0A550C3R3_9AGAR|nr:hypothetical protein BD626DRAFT_572723 [Auriculariopsis ampla]
MTTAKGLFIGGVLIRPPRTFRCVAGKTGGKVRGNYRQFPSTGIFGLECTYDLPATPRSVSDVLQSAFRGTVASLQGRRSGKTVALGTAGKPALSSIEFLLKDVHQVLNTYYGPHDLPAALDKSRACLTPLVGGRLTLSPKVLFIGGYVYDRPHSVEASRTCYKARRVSLLVRQIIVHTTSLHLPLRYERSPRSGNGGIIVDFVGRLSARGNMHMSHTYLVASCERCPRSRDGGLLTVSLEGYRRWWTYVRSSHTLRGLASAPPLQDGEIIVDFHGSTDYGTYDLPEAVGASRARVAPLVWELLTPPPKLSLLMDVRMDLVAAEYGIYDFPVAMGELTTLSASGYTYDLKAPSRARRAGATRDAPRRDRFPSRISIQNMVYTNPPVAPGESKACLTALVE